MLVGHKVIYPSQGPCLISAVVKKVVGGTPTRFYCLAPLGEGNGELFVPVDKIGSLGIRQLLKRSEIPKLLTQLRKANGVATNWKQRAIDNVKLMASGSAFDLAQVVESLSALNETKALSPNDRQTFDRAKKLLVCEIAEVMGETRLTAEEHVDDALKARPK
jgi:CarD family transcriptional regulator